MTTRPINAPERRRCPACHSMVPVQAFKCRHCHHYLGYSLAWAWAEGARVLGLLAMVAAVVVAVRSMELTEVAQRQKDDAVAQALIARQERNALKEDMAAGAGARAQQRLAEVPDKSLQAASAKSGDPRVKRLLELALKLKRGDTPYAVAGKSPEEGFDSSGFVAYLLADVGALDPRYARAFSVAHLERAFVSVEPKHVKPGDLAFIGKAFVAVALGDGLAVGIGSAAGIQVFSIPPQASCSYRRWAYEEGSTLVR